MEAIRTSNRTLSRQIGRPYWNGLICPLFLTFPFRCLHRYQIHGKSVEYIKPLLHPNYKIIVFFYAKYQNPEIVAFHPVL
jgi:hypothetical protein